MLPPSARSPRSPGRGFPRLGSTTRRYRVLLPFVAITAIVLIELYLRTSESSFKLLLGGKDSSTHGAAPNEEPGLWSYIGDEPGSEVWSWAIKQRRAGYRRPSWGGLSQQGPKAHVRANLIQGNRYLTAFLGAGFNNQVMETCNILAVALRAKRIPILAPFEPDINHLNNRATFISVSEVFDLTDLINHYQTPVIDLLELKVGREAQIPIDDRHRSVVFDGEHPQLSGDGDRPLESGDMIKAEAPQLDQLHCWNAFLAVRENQGWEETTLQPAELEQTPLPLSAYADKPREQNSILTIGLPGTAEAVLAFSHPNDTLPADTVARMKELGREPSRMSPDDPFGCINRAYFMHMNPDKGDIHDDWRVGVGAWDEVGKYLKYQPGLVKLADDLLRSLMGVAPGEETPKYMAVHIRRTDFKDNYSLLMTQRRWAHQAWELLHEVKDKEGLDIRHVVFTTDEQDENWLRELRDIGWIHIDHAKARTGERLGWWFPTFLDSVILSSADVFMGIPTSTMSILPYNRVRTWKGGIARFIRDPTRYQVPEDWQWAQDW